MECVFRRVWTARCRCTRQNNAGEPNHPAVAVARLRPGVTLQAAQAEMDTIAERLAKQYPDSNSFVGVRATKPVRRRRRQHLRTNLLVCGAVGLVFARQYRQPDVRLAATRTARGRGAARAGASRSRLATDAHRKRAAGNLWRFAGSRTRMVCAELSVPVEAELHSADTQVGWDAAVLGFTCLVSLGVAALFGLWPALRITSRNSATFCFAELPDFVRAFPLTALPREPLGSR